MDPNQKFYFYNWNTSIVSPPCLISTYIPRFDTSENQEIVPHADLCRFRNNIVYFRKEIKIYKYQLIKCKFFYMNHDVWSLDYKSEMDDKLFELNTAAMDIQKEENVAVMKDFNTDSWGYLLRATKTLIQESGMYLESCSNLNDIAQLRIEYAEDVDSKYKKISDDFGKFQHHKPPFKQSCLTDLIDDVDRLVDEVDFVSREYRSFDPVMSKVESCAEGVRNSREKLIVARKIFKKCYETIEHGYILVVSSEEETNEETD